MVERNPKDAIMELAEEKYVRNLFEELYGIRLLKVPESTLRGVKTFDYALLDGDERVAAVEIKSFKRAPISVENGWVQTGPHSFTRTGPDNAPSRVGRAIREACKQLSSSALVKVLVLLNDDTMLDALDLKAAFNGYLVYGTEATGFFKDVAALKVANGKIRDEKWTVDLYVWINRYNGLHKSRPSGLSPQEERGPFIHFTSDAGYGLARKHFGVPEVPKPEPGSVDRGIGTLHDMLMRQSLGDSARDS